MPPRRAATTELRSARQGALHRIAKHVLVCTANSPPRAAEFGFPVQGRIEGGPTGKRTRYTQAKHLTSAYKVQVYDERGWATEAR